ncbi:hypothetical protein THARTR1_01884 [Trichoderma harzianum]|uniref:Retrovirus-related Pol polyprotein from transposon TNT 1-94-like beta-barrel domain-containing protein n=1 Tax=Trichoderma harzianum TaxID=5544 RepID=A0A2K0UKQ3_TRIHA|nr:hypothetical protein THARTR1_01884 [Trichoderma harzianum]
MGSLAPAEAPMACQDSPQGLSADWIFSNGSNVHICNDRRWFTELTPFKSAASSVFGSGDVTVEGVGIVNLPVKRDPNQRGPQAHHVLRLTNVLYAPCSEFNILGSPLAELAPRIMRNPTRKKKGSLEDEDGNRVAFFSPNAPLFCLRLSGPPVGPRLAPTKLEPNGEYALMVTWPDSERARWNARGQQDESETESPQWADEQPYAAREKAWLKKHRQGEYKLLILYGLSIYNEEERAEGRAITEDTEDDEDDDDDDEFAHLADYHFDDKELAWIKKHYRNSATFMFSYGFKFYDDEDCAEATGLVKAFMIDGE